MNIIALDTCTECCSAALLYEGRVFERVEMTQRGHSDLILGMMDELFNAAGTSVSAIDAVAFGRGPGSFTGVRIGVAVAQGIAFARDVPVIPISSLAAIAQRAADQLDIDTIAVAMDARMGEIYCACYQALEDGIVKLVDTERVCQPEQFVADTLQQWHGIGTAWRIYDEVLRQNFSQNIVAIHAEYYSLASSVLKLAKIAAEAGHLLPVEQALPVYLRDNVAKKKAEQNNA